MLVIDMSSSNRNIEQGSKASLSINVGNHQYRDNVDPHYIGGIVGSTAGSPRVNFKGKFVDYEGSEALVGACFAKRHRDAVVWYPNNPIHSSHWSKFEIEEVYFVGGFGDRAYIGTLPVDEYLNAKTFDEDDEEYQKFLFGDEVENQFNERKDVNDESDETSDSSSLFQGLFSSFKSVLNQIAKEVDVHTSNASSAKTHKSGCKEHMRVGVLAINVHHPVKVKREQRSNPFDSELSSHGILSQHINTAEIDTFTLIKKTHHHQRLATCKQTITDVTTKNTMDYFTSVIMGLPDELNLHIYKAFLKDMMAYSDWLSILYADKITDIVVKEVLQETALVFGQDGFHCAFGRSFTSDGKEHVDVDEENVIRYRYQDCEKLEKFLKGYDLKVGLMYVKQFSIQPNEFSPFVTHFKTFSGHYDKIRIEGLTMLCLLEAQDRVTELSFELSIFNQSLESKFRNVTFAKLKRIIVHVPQNNYVKFLEHFFKAGMMKFLLLSPIT
ncbi:unnamed protein product [Ambrosiozyma monospora]|uniref:Unnamed protein product n=1 Tax=Ambrosiozyma monospora TaxID=43982 RepID=A0ACB5TW38_AMBMO|nr:unnamed protein product [Ambrosiozyma monospora]